MGGTVNSGLAKKALLAVAVLWTLFLCGFMTVVDLYSPSALVLLDYDSCFFGAGWLAAHQRWGMLYPSLSVHTFAGAPFDVFIHKVFPTFPSSMVANFMYCPLVAYMFAPLSTIAPNFGLLTWQAVSVLLLALSCWCIAATLGSKSQTLGSALWIFFLSFLYMPLFHTLWLGQVDIALGLLPLAAGYYLMDKEKNFAAGLVLSFTFLKPQLLPAALLMCIGLAFRKEVKPLIGLLLGIGLLVVCIASFYRGELLVLWLHSLRISDTLFTGSVRNPEFLVAGLPGGIMNAFPMQMRGAVKPVAYGFGVMCLVAVILLLWKLAKSSLDSKRWLVLNAVVSVSALICCSPRFLVYNWVILILPIALALAWLRREKLILVPVLLLVLFINVELLVQFTALAKVNPFLFTTASALALCTMLVGIYKLRTRISNQELHVAGENNVIGEV